MASRSIWPPARSIGCVYPISTAGYQIISPGIKEPFFCVCLSPSMSVCGCACCISCWHCGPLALSAAPLSLSVCLSVRPSGCLFILAALSALHKSVFRVPFVLCNLTWCNVACNSACQRAPQALCNNINCNNNNNNNSYATAIHMIHLTWPAASAERAAVARRN